MHNELLPTIGETYLLPGKSETRQFEVSNISLSEEGDRIDIELRLVKTEQIGVRSV